MIEEYHLDLNGIEILDQNDPEMKATREKYAQKLYKLRQRKGMTYVDALLRDELTNQFEMMMVTDRRRRCFSFWIFSKYADVIKPAIQTAGTNNPQKHYCQALYIVHAKKGTYFFAGYHGKCTALCPTHTGGYCTVMVAEQVSHFTVEAGNRTGILFELGAIQGTPFDQGQGSVC